MGTAVFGSLIFGGVLVALLGGLIAFGAIVDRVVEDDE